MQNFRFLSSTMGPQCVCKNLAKTYSKILKGAITLFVNWLFKELWKLVLDGHWNSLFARFQILNSEYVTSFLYLSSYIMNHIPSSFIISTSITTRSHLTLQRMKVKMSHIVIIFGTNICRAICRASKSVTEYHHHINWVNSVSSQNRRHRILERL